MKMHVPKAMVEQFDINIMTKLWVTINNNDLITQQLSEYLKLVEIVMMSMLRFTKDEWTFSTLAFMRNKLHN
jgi:antitoxin component of MazEF toxin-antitoxin module